MAFVMRRETAAPPRSLSSASSSTRVPLFELDIDGVPIEIHGIWAMQVPPSHVPSLGLGAVSAFGCPRADQVALNIGFMRSFA